MKIFLIDPSLKKSKKNVNYLLKLKLKKNKIKNYVAPLYNPKKINDRTLIRKIKQFKPQIILINLGGATAKEMESLGEYVRKVVYEKYKISLDWEVIRVGRK